MARLPYPETKELPADAIAALTTFPIQLNIIRIMTYAHTLIVPLVDTITAIHQSLQLTPKWREMVTLLVAYKTECRYIWNQHLPQAIAAGMSDAALITNVSRISTDPAEHALLTAVRRYLANEPWDDGTVVELLQYFAPREIVELLVLIGIVRMVTYIIRSLDVEMDAQGNVSLQDWTSLAPQSGSVS